VSAPAARSGGQRQYTALILAGSRGAADPVASAARLPHKALVPIAGRAMVLRVIDTLRQIPEVGRIVLCIDDPRIVTSLPELRAAVEAGEIATVAAAHSPAASVLAALKRVSEPLPLLIATADHPLLTAEMVRYFLGALGDAEAAATVATEALIAPAYPQTRRTYVRLKDGAYSGCNLFAFVSPDAARRGAVLDRGRTLPKAAVAPVRSGWTVVAAPLSAAAPRSRRCRGAPLSNP